MKGSIIKLPKKISRCIMIIKRILRILTIPLVFCLIYSCQKPNDIKTPNEEDNKKQYENFYYTEDDKGITVTGYSGDEKNIVLPEKIDGKPVVAIASKAFELQKFESIKIPESVTDIGSYAFRHCINLKDVKINGKITAIEMGTFNYCSSLNTFTIPPTVETIEENAFGKTPLSEVILPDSVKSIGKFSYFGCENLKTFTSGKGLKQLYGSCFAGCTSLENVNLQEGVELLGENCFSGCSSLKNITLPNTVKLISKYAFQATSLEKIIIPDSTETIERHAFANCMNLTDIYIPKTVKEIQQYTFEGTKGFTIHGIPDSPAEIHADMYGYKFKSTEQN